MVGLPANTKDRTMVLTSIRTVLIGLGNVNLGLLKILQSRQDSIRDQYHLKFVVVGIADSSGVAVNPAGWLPAEVLELKNQKRKAAEIPGYLPGVSTELISDHVQADLLIESSSGNINNGQPGLNTVRHALAKGWSVVLANKTPLIFAFDELMFTSQTHGGKLAYSATVCGGLPVINVLQRDLKLASLKGLRGIFNATSNFVLQELGRGGSIEDAIRQAQSIGAAEADPSHDIDGHDSANKLFIIMKSFTQFSGSINDIHMEGIRQITSDQIELLKASGSTVKLVAEAVFHGKNWHLSVGPRELPAQSFLGSCNGWEMGVEIETDLYDKIYLKNYEADPVGTSAAVLRDSIDLVRS